VEIEKSFHFFNGWKREKMSTEENKLKHFIKSILPSLIRKGKYQKISTKRCEDLRRTGEDDFTLSVDDEFTMSEVMISGHKLAWADHTKNTRTFPTMIYVPSIRMAGHPDMISSFLKSEGVDQRDINSLLSSAFTKENYKSEEPFVTYNVGYDDMFVLSAPIRTDVTIADAFVTEKNMLKSNKVEKKVEKEKKEQTLLCLSDLPTLMELIEKRREASKEGTMFSSQEMKKKDKDREKGMRSKSNLLRDKSYFDSLLSKIETSYIYRVDNCKTNGTGCNRSKIPTKGSFKRLGEQGSLLYNAGFMYKAKLDRAYNGALNFLTLYLENEEEAKNTLSTVITMAGGERR
jgi:hypothetical protein